MAIQDFGAAVVAGQQYVFLQAEKEIALNRRALDESSLIAMKTLGGESTLELLNKEVALRKTIIEGVDSTAKGMIRQLEIRAIADFIAWCVVLVISGWALFLNDRMRAERGENESG